MLCIDQTGPRRTFLFLSTVFSFIPQFRINEQTPCMLPNPPPPRLFFPAYMPFIPSSHLLRTRQTLSPLRPITRSSDPQMPSRAISRSSSPTCFVWRHTSSNTNPPSPVPGPRVQVSSSVLDRGATRPTPGPPQLPTSASRRAFMASNGMPIKSVTCISVPSSSHTGGLYVRHHSARSTPR